jgi:hypothetical protein
MATRKQKEQLMSTLRFTPRMITITLSGYGGEIVMGTVDPAAARYWINRGDFEEYATAWSDDEGKFADVPEPYNIINEGSWHEIDDLAHSCGVEMSAGCWLTVRDEMTGETLLETELDPEILDTAGIGFEHFESVEVEPTPTQAVFVGQNFEKGLFFEAETEITEPFDPARLKFGFSTYDGWRVCNTVAYNDEELDGQDAYSTTGKSSSYELYLDDDSVLEGEETPAQHLIDESDLGPWHATVDHNPVHVGYYDCQVASTAWPDQRLHWNGTEWIMDNGEAMRLHVVQWRGLNHPVVDQ